MVKVLAGKAKQISDFVWHLCQEREKDVYNTVTTFWEDRQIDRQTGKQRGRDSGGCVGGRKEGRENAHERSNTSSPLV